MAAPHERCLIEAAITAPRRPVGIPELRRHGDRVHNVKARSTTVTLAAALLCYLVGAVLDSP